MSRLRMVSGMAAAVAGAAKDPALAVCGFVRAVLCAGFGGLCIAAKAVWRAGRVVIACLVLAAMVLLLSYLVYLFACHLIAQASIAAEATKHENAFIKSLEAANDSAEDLDINSRIRAMVDSRLGERGESVPGSEKGRWLSSLDGVPDKPMMYRSLTAIVVSPEDGTEHTVRLTVMNSLASQREYISVELSGEQAYLCVAEYGDIDVPEDLWPWVYRGIGRWEHLLDMTESFVDTDRQQREVDSRFGNLEEVE